MMHYIDTIVTIVDNNRKPVRELESEKQEKGRKCKVFLPFDTEYQFFIKNNSDRRIKLEIEIDGSIISGDGLIVSEYANTYLERFLNSNEKFKFVKASHEAVADPTNRENGIIKVRVYKENKPITISHPVWTSGYIRSPAVFNNDTVIGGVLNDCCYTSRNLDSNALNCCASLGEAGATVGGSLSNQSFTETYWYGDNGVESVFTFIMYGTNSSEREEKLKQYLKLKQELGIW